MDAIRSVSFLIAYWLFCCFTCNAIQHTRNLIWAQTPALRLTVSRLVGIEGDPEQWVPAKSPNVKHISAPHYGWEFKGLGFSYQRQMLVWSEAMNKKIQALYLNGSTETIDIFTGTSPEVNGLVVDWMGNNVYWTDALYNWVVMAPLQPYSTDRIFRIIVQEGLDNPHGLAIWPESCRLFLSDWGVRPRIEQLTLLGEKRFVLVDDDIIEPRGLAIDYSQSRLYWVDSAKDTVESILIKDHRVGFQRKIVNVDVGTRFFDLALSNDYVFLTEQSQGLLKVLHEDLKNGSISFTLGNVPYGIIMYDEAQQPGVDNVCADMNCSHICAYHARYGAVCACGEGYILDEDDKKSCILENKFTHPSHLYAIGVAICMYPVHIADMSLANVSLNSQCFLSDRFGYLALTFEAADNMLFYSGNYTNTISVIPLESGAKAKVVASGTGTVKGLALDWVVGTLYWTDSTNAYIKMSRKDGRFQRILLEEDVNNPLGIAVHPARGKIYWTDIGFQPDVLPKIESANMDGTGREVLLKDNLGQPNHILIDYNTDKLYWADSVLHHVRQYDLNDRSMSVFFEQPNVKFYGISLYKDYILWTDTEDMNGIHVARLDTGVKVRGIIHPNYGMAADVITFDKLNQPPMNTTCDNHHCSQLCLPQGAETFTCACGLGFQLQGTTDCVIGDVAQDNFLIVNDAYQRNMYQVDTKDGTIRAMSNGERHEPIAIGFHPPPLNTIYWSDNTVHVLRRKRLGQSSPESFLNLPENSVVDGLAIDAQNNLLFYTDTGRDLIAVVSTSVWPPRQAAIVTEGHDEPRAIALSLPDRKIFWTDWGTNATISEALMNGEDRKVVVRFNQTAWPNGLAIDSTERVLYWADASNNNIGMYMLDSQKHRILIIEPTAHYFGLFVMGDFLYVTDWKRSFVARMHKKGGELRQVGEAKFTKLYGITGFNSTETPLGGRGICADQSKCDNVSICVPHVTVAFVCVCIDGYIRQGHQCVRVAPENTITTTTTSFWDASSSSSTSSPFTNVPGNTSGNNDSDNKGESSTQAQIPITFDDKDDDNNKADNSSDDSGPDHRLHPTTAGPGSEDSGDPGKTSNESGDKGSSSSSSSSNGGKDGSSGGGWRPDDPHGERKLNESSHIKTGILVGVLVAVVALVLALVLAAILYFRRRRGYNVPHTRLTEDRRGSWREGMGRGTGGSPTSSSIASSSGSCSKVTYARHNSNDSVRFDEGFENPTYEVTMAMMMSADDNNQSGFTSFTTIR